MFLKLSDRWYLPNKMRIPIERKEDIDLLPRNNCPLHAVGSCRPETGNSQ